MKSLRRIFLAAALLLATSASEASTTADTTTVQEQTDKKAIKRRLTANEVALARTVFGDAIDYDRVRITNRRAFVLGPREKSMAPFNTIYLPDDYQPDFGADSVRWGQSDFIHEMAHIWQRQNGLLLPVKEAVRLTVKFRFKYRDSYDYELDRSKDLLDYNMEQQASIIADYFSLRKRDMKIFATMKPEDAEKAIMDHVKNLQDYEAVLENFLKDPSYVSRALRPKRSAGNTSAPR